jgi:hypothetical protein
VKPYFVHTFLQNELKKRLAMDQYAQSVVMWTKKVIVRLEAQRGDSGGENLVRVFRLA